MFSSCVFLLIKTVAAVYWDTQASDCGVRSRQISMLTKMQEVSLSVLALLMNEFALLCLCRAHTLQMSFPPGCHCAGAQDPFVWIYLNIVVLSIKQLCASFSKGNQMSVICRHLVPPHWASGWLDGHSQPFLFFVQGSIHSEWVSCCVSCVGDVCLVPIQGYLI